MIAGPPGRGFESHFFHLLPPPLSFIGSIDGWSGASPTEEDNDATSTDEAGERGQRLDELWIDAGDRTTRIVVSFSGEQDEGVGTTTGVAKGKGKERTIGFSLFC